MMTFTVSTNASSLNVDVRNITLKTDYTITFTDIDPDFIVRMIDGAVDLDKYLYIKLVGNLRDNIKNRVCTASLLE